MKTIHIIKTEMKKTIMNPGFFLSVIITFLLQFTTQVYVDGLTGKTYSVLEVLLNLDREILESDYSLSSYFIMKSGLAGYFVMFIPILAAFPFIPNFCAERNSGLIRFTIQREGKFRYYITKFLSAILGGGAAVLLGYILFIAIIYCLFPSIQNYGLSADEISMVMGKEPVIQGILIFLGVFLYGCVSSVPAFCMASFARNRYIITCVPFMVVYLYSSGLTKLIYDGIEENNQRKMDIGNILKPEQITTLYYRDTISRYTLFIQLGFVLIAFLLFVCIMNKRKDLGD